MSAINDQACRKPDWEIRREIRPGTYRTYAHGYWRDPLVVHVLGRTLWGKRALRRRWAAVRRRVETGQPEEDT